jgi:succinate dehydrogenase/fumarate reductase iron-sulfur protein
MREAILNISRYDPSKDNSPVFKEYRVPMENRSTLLSALIYIHENIDSTLAFRYGCRFKNCGLCGLNVNGNPRLACMTRLKEEMEIVPLNNLPIVRDLVIDRKPFFDSLSRFKPYVVRGTEPEKEPEVVIFPKEHTELMNCRECMICLSQCNEYDYRKMDFGGPLAFIKLAQLHYDPRDTLNRKKMAKELGIDKCKDCKKCYCPVGINIFRMAIESLI